MRAGGLTPDQREWNKTPRAFARFGKKDCIDMMILRNSPASPFGRKVRMAIKVLGLDKEIEIRAADTNDPNDDLRLQNALGKIPTLIGEDGTAYYDSRVIVEYLDTHAGGGRIIPRDGKVRFAALRLQALCDGICDASLLQVYEGRYRPAEKHEEKWVSLQAGKVERGLKELEASPPAIDATPNVGQIALACALGYRDLRFEGKWRKGHPKLVAWLDKFAAQVPAFEETRFKG
jgi:glutathione S-transferase